jgi:hypothetical protein
MLRRQALRGMRVADRDVAEIAAASPAGGVEHGRTGNGTFQPAIGEIDDRPP